MAELPCALNSAHQSERLRAALGRRELCGNLPISVLRPRCILDQPSRQQYERRDPQLAHALTLILARPNWNILDVIHELAGIAVGLGRVEHPGFLADNGGLVGSTEPGS